MIKTIFFDLDDTLLDFTRSEASALRRALTEAGAPAGQPVLDRYHVINQRQWELLEEGVLTREQVKSSRFHILFSELGISCAKVEAVKDRYEKYLAEQHWLLPGAEELLKELASRYRLCLASNGSVAIQYSRLKLAGIGPYFDRIFISEELGANKPDKAFFDRCFEALPEVDPAEILMVGDSLTSDIRGGQNAGIRTCWFNPHGKLVRAGICPDYTITSLEQLPALLARIG